VIFRRRLTPLPVSDAVKRAVEAIEKSEGQGNLKITSPGGHIINDSSLIAGVSQYDNDEDDGANEDIEEDDGTNDDIDTIHPEPEGNDTDPYATNDENDDDNEDTVLPDDEDDYATNEQNDNENENTVLPDDEDDSIQEYALEPEQNEPTARRSERVRRQPMIYEPTMYGQTCETTIRGSTHTQVTPVPTTYTTAEAIVLAHILSEFNERLYITTTVQGSSFVTTYSLQKGLQQFGDRAKQTTLQEMQQLHDRKCFQPIHKKLSATPSAHARWNRSSF
jgi:hypothetical protein